MIGWRGWRAGAAAVSTLWLGSGGFCGDREAVSGNPPPEWEELGGDLSTVEEALALPRAPGDPGRPEPEAEWLVQEDRVRVAPDGSTLSVHHRIRRLNQEEAAEDFNRLRIGFRPGRTRVHVVTARTVLPDGESVPAGSEELLVEPVEDGGEGLFGDRRQVCIVFPKIRPGAVIELVYVEESRPWFGDHWEVSTIWGGFVPVGRQRLVIECPAEMAERLAWEAWRVDVLPVREELGDGRVRFAWEAAGSPPIVREPGMPPLGERGPLVRVGLEGNWEAFGRWFSGEFSGAQPADGKLRELARQWAGGAEEPGKVADRILQTLTREVQLLRPEASSGERLRSPLEVRETGQGDPVEVAGLYRALLAGQGIPSRWALLCPLGPGGEPGKVVAMEAFEHVVVAVDVPGQSEPLFGDPSVAGLPLGLISERDQSRDVFLVGESGELERGRLPGGPAVVEQIRADLDLEPDGGLAGWWEVRVGGAYGWHLRRRYGEWEREERLDDALERFFAPAPSLRLVDCEPGAEEGKDWPFHYRFYALHKAETEKPEGDPVRLRFPAIRLLEPPGGRRVHPHLGVPAALELTATIRIPERWTIGEVPEGWAAEQSGYSFAAGWTEGGERVVQGAVRMERRRRDLTAKEFPGYAEGLGKLAEWRKRAIQLKPNPAVAADETEEWKPDPATLPRMPSGDGYAALAGERFPFDPKSPLEADHRSRRIAFQRMEELYGKEDAGAELTAKVMVLGSRLFRLPTSRQVRHAIRSLGELSGEYEGRVDARKIAGLELMLAGALSYAEKTEASIGIFKNLLEREGVPEAIRQAAGGMLSIQIAGDEPSRGAELAKLGLANGKMPDLEWAFLAGIYLDCLARLAGDEVRRKLPDEIKDLMRTYPERKEAFKDSLLRGPDRLMEHGRQREAREFRDVLRAEAEVFGLAVADLEPIDFRIAAMDRVAPLHRRLVQHLGRNPWPDLQRVERGDRIESAADCVEVSIRDCVAGFRYVLRGLVEFGPQANFADRISELHALAEQWFEESGDPEREVPAPPAGMEALLDLTLELWKQSPDGKEVAASDARLAEGELIRRRKGGPEAEGYFAVLAEDPAVSPSTRRMAATRLRALERERSEPE